MEILVHQLTTALTPRSDLSERDAPREFIKKRAERFEEVENLRPIFVIEVFLASVRVARMRDEVIGDRERRIAPELFIVEVEVDSVEAKPIDPTLQPPASD